jgi:hypothetical protein
MDWTSLLFAIGIIYIAYEAGRWAQREQFKQDAEVHVMIMKAFEKAREQSHYQDIVDHNEEMEKEKEEYKKHNKKMWSELEQQAEKQWKDIKENGKKAKRTDNTNRRD